MVMLDYEMFLIYKNHSKIIEVELLILERSVNKWALIDQSRNLILFLKSEFQIFQMFGMIPEHPTHGLKIEI